MTELHLERRDPAKNQFRFYRLVLAPTLFGDWSVMREWGRIGGRPPALTEVQRHEVRRMRDEEGFCPLPRTTCRRLWLRNQKYTVPRPPQS